mgnify:CR=1 FL=1
MFEQDKSCRGVALYLTVMVMALILVMALGTASLLVSQIRMVRDMGDSVLVFYATETGIERSLFALSQGETGPVWQETLSNNASYTATFENPGEGGCPATILNYCLKSIGVYNGIRRGIRIAR